MSLADSLATLEESLSSVQDDLTIEVEVTLKVNDDIPAGYVEDTRVSCTNGIRASKVIAASNGIATKTIRIYIPD